MPNPGPLAPLSASPDLERLTERMVRMAPQMNRLNAQADKARAGLEARTADWLPRVALFGRYELLPDELTALEPRWSAGVAFEWQLLDDGNRFRERRAALARLDQARAQREQSRTDLISRLRQDHRDLRRAEANIDALASSETLVQERVTMTRRGYEQGLNTALDWAEAQTTLAAIRLQRLNATAAQHRALARLYIHAGAPDAFFDLLRETTPVEGTDR